ncbi:unnamed protein product [Brachionus calyciflorus]|uniref:Uncharacterized protein n=1 Tax=Brachionus calyciflorus TaxID=104777 RepID=A0A814NYZ7_9BILA|nr:unnamed protein product [Brachionus calyciflorus]
MNQAYNFLRLEGSPTIENPIKMDVKLKIDEDLMNSIIQQIKSDLFKPGSEWSRSVSEWSKSVSDWFKSVSDWFKVCTIVSMGAFTIGYYGAQKNVKMEKCMFVSSLVGIGCGLFTQNSIKNLDIFSFNVAFGLTTGLFVCLVSYKYGRHNPE